MGGAKDGVRRAWHVAGGAFNTSWVRICLKRSAIYLHPSDPHPLTSEGRIWISFSNQSLPARIFASKSSVLSAISYTEVDELRIPSACRVMQRTLSP